MNRALVVSGLTAAVALAASGAGARAASSACPTSNPPNELVLAGGSGQQAQLGKQFAQNLQVALANTNGCPLTGNLAGVTVNFDAPGSGASGIFAGSGSREAYVGTDSQGVATAPPFTANFTVGNYTVDAHSDYGTVELSLSNAANGLPSSIAATGTASQEATVNGSYGQPLQARVTDANGNPVQGAAVSFSILPGTHRCERELPRRVHRARPPTRTALPPHRRSWQTAFRDGSARPRPPPASRRSPSTPSSTTPRP